MGKLAEVVDKLREVVEVVDAIGEDSGSNRESWRKW